MLPSRTVEIRRDSVGSSGHSNHRCSRAVARLDARGHEIAADLGIDVSTSPLVGWLALIVLTPVIGSRLAGIPFGVGFGVFAVLLPIPLVRLGAGRRRARVRLQLPELCAQLSRSLRSGNTLHGALELAVEESDDVAPMGLTTTVRELRMGRPLDESLLDWSNSADHEAERLLVAALRLGVAIGGDVAVCLDAVASGVRDEISIESKRREITAQARMSAWVLAALPVGFGLVMSAARGEPVHQGTSGLVFVGVGLTLDGAGLFWMFRLVGGVR